MVLRLAFYVIFLLTPLHFFAQQLMINEVSQGTSGAQEYVEFIVAGTPVCTTPLPCLDLRTVIIDDNNGNFATGSNTGIAHGAVRFANNVFWQCIPQGTLILIYNDADPNPAVPANDLSMTDGNNRLVIPISSSLFEETTSAPNTSDPNYPTTTASWTSGGNWTNISMSNSNDSFQLPNGNSGTANHAVSWGNNTSNTIIYFSGSAASIVYSFTNNTSNNWSLQANWTSASATTGQTPGLPNNTANASWIAAMNTQSTITLNLTSTNETCLNSCDGTASVTASNGTAPYTYNWSNSAVTSSISSICPGTYTVTVTDNAGCTATDSVSIIAGNSLVLIMDSTNETCLNNCDGTASVTASNGTIPYTYLWSNNATTTSLTSLCPGTYFVAVTDNNGCTATDQVTIQAGLTNPDATIQAAGPFAYNDSPFQLTATTSGGTWTSSSCGSCISSSGQFSPQLAGPGTWQICYTVGAGNCSDQDCIEIVVTGCQPEYTTENQTLCYGDSLYIYGNWIYTSGSYPHLYTSTAGCDSIHTIQVSFAAGCGEDSVTIFIPNVFTPNGDLTNDLFTITYSGGTIKEGIILNRWGELMGNLIQSAYYPNEMYWNGTNKNTDKLADEGVYFYKIITKSFSGKEDTYHGFVTLIR